MGKRLDTKTFIERAKNIHADEYDYSLVDYKNNKTKVKIVCKKHGTFEQLPINHIESKSGCHKCYGNNKLTTEEFIQRAKLKHDNNYDYSLVDYKTDKLKVKIICKKHGIFLQTPNVHLSGHGCFKCARKNDLETFLEKSKLIYGDLYDYSFVEYVNVNTSVKIVCKEHGEFEIIPSTFLYGKNGCFYCNGQYKNIDFFIKDAKEIHGNKYQYKMIDNLESLSLIKVICPTHGEFTQRISSHIDGSGCKRCADDLRRKKLGDFIFSAKKIHNNKYDYDEVKYTNTSSKVKIKCSIHGYFNQRPKQHLRGEGCPSCNESKGEKEISVYLDNKSINYHREFKFDDCKNINSLKFDFYLPDHNLCIEYDGKQHFESMDIFGGDIEFEKRKINDRIKDDYCSKNKIRLIRISYSDNIFKILCNLPI